MTKILYTDKLDNCVERWRSAGLSVIGPVRNANITAYRPVGSAADLELSQILPDRSIKELFFPQTEPMMRYSIKKDAINTEECLPPVGPRIIFGARPCDASGLAIDDPLFGWDYKDEYWFNRRNETVIVSIACTKSDEFCMCTSLKLSPDSTKGSDVLLRPLESGKGWQVEELTDRGREAFKAIAELLTEGAEAAAPTAVVAEKFDADACSEWLRNPENFESRFWKEISVRCIGCGSCTYLCPTCLESGDGDLYVMDMVSKKSTRLTALTGYDGGGFFSPDGKKIVWRADRNGDNLLQIYIADVVFDSTGAVSGIGQPLAVTNDGAVNWAPYFSPNGKVIVYASSRVGHDNYEILAVPVPSDRDAPLGQPRRVTYADGADLLPAISPDGKLLMWTSQRGPGRSSQLWLADMSQQDLLLGELVAPAAEKSPTSSATTPSATAPNNSATTPTAQPK